MKILIIGSKGFIGSHCVSFFSQESEVWESDVVVDYVNKRYFLVDAVNSDFIEIFQVHKFDICINCSGAASVPDSFIHPLRDYNLNTANVFKMLEAIRRFNPNCKFINLSSAAVYGNPAKLPINELDQLKPISPYGWHKSQAETLCREFFHLYKIRTLSLRVFSVYGEGLRKQIFWDIFQKTKGTDHIILFGTGEETRDFIYIKDLVRALDCIIKHAEFNGEAVNIASGRETKIREAAIILCGYINPGIRVSFNQQVKEGDPLFWKADISRLSKCQFENKYSIESGLQNMTKWLQEENLP